MKRCLPEVSKQTGAVVLPQRDDDADRNLCVEYMTGHLHAACMPEPDSSIKLEINK